MSDENANTDGGGAGAGDGQGADQNASPAPKLEIPDGFAYAKDGAIDFDAWGKDAEELTSLRDAAAKRAEGVPEAADGYAINVSEDWKYADGSPQEVDTADPLWGEVRAVAHEFNLPQAALDKLVALHAQAERAGRDGLSEQSKTAGAEAEKAQALELAKLADANETDDKKIVAQVEARTSNIDNWLTQLFGEKGAAVAMQLKSSAAIEVFEALQEATKDVEIGGAKPNGESKAEEPTAKTLYPNLWA